MIPITTKAASRRMNADQGFFLRTRESLERFHGGRQAERPGMFAGPPEDVGMFPFAVPHIAAAVHKPAEGFGPGPPGRAFDGRYLLPRGRRYFGFRASGLLRKRHMRDCPPEFKFRNLSVDGDVPSRG